MEIQTEEEYEKAKEMELGRRRFLSKAGVGVAGFAASSAILAACGGGTDEGAASGDTDTDTDTDTGGGDSDSGSSDDDVVSDAEIIESSQDAPEIEWEMATSWPTGLVTLFGSAQFFAEQVSRLTNGRFQITARPAGELTGGLEVLQGVSDLSLIHI